MDRIKTKKKPTKHGKKRATPGTQSHNRYYHIIVKPKSDFVTFRVHDVGRRGHAERLAGKRSDGGWGTHAWLISKDDAHIEGNTLIADEKKTKKIFSEFNDEPKQIDKDIFGAEEKQSKKIKSAKSGIYRRKNKDNKVNNSGW